MKIEEYRRRIMDPLIVEISITAPLNLIWLAWVDSNRITTWFAPEANIELWVGGAFELFFDPPNHEKESTIGCVFIAIEEKKRLVFTWKGPSKFAKVMNNPSSLTSIEVIFREMNGTTHLTVKHRGWSDGETWTRARNWHLTAWKAVLKSLKSAIDSGEDLLWCLSEENDG